MDPLSALSVLIGALIVVTRGPMIFAPATTLRFYNKLISTNARIRGVTVVIAPLVVALIGLPLGEGQVAGILRILGWVWAAAVVWLLAAPDSYRQFAGVFLDILESSDDAIVRMVGVVAVALGVALIYFGLYVA